MGGKGWVGGWGKGEEGEERYRYFDDVHHSIEHMFAHKMSSS